ncbi:hypothetical protein CP10743SC13_0743 [Chlamydia psittaci 10_743_SC13]|nr:hypothetical protein CP10743SC13_0743 [Chlamydia psittaci 10_743_SC13]
MLLFLKFMHRAFGIPGSYLRVIREKCPRVIHSLCMDQRLTIQELRQVVSVLGDKLSIDHLTANIPPPEFV